MALGKKIRIYYDPRGQAIRTVNPDDSFQTVFFGNVTDLEHPENYEPSPWVSFTYDANDNADRRASGPGLTPSSHFNTPKSAEIDALGRTIKTTEHNAHYNGSSYEDVVMQYKYDIRGNLLEVTDPNSRIAFTHKYDYANRGLWTEHLDSGSSTVNMDVMGKPVEATDAKGARVLNSYDVLNRPIRLWAKDNSLAASFTLRQYLIYGDDLTATGYTDTQTKDLNLYGKGWKAFDEAGMVHTEPYDFKGNLIEKTKQVISDSELLSVFSGPPVNWQVNPYIVDWTGLNTSKLDSQVFTTTMEYDALNRAMKVTYPEDVNGNRKELTPTYNRAGVLHKVSFDGTEYIKEIAYNAKGQPLLTAYGNSMMTRFVYDENTFRTARLKTEKYVYTTPSGVHTYTPQSGTTKQDFAYEYDLIGNIMKLHDRTPDCGVSGTPDELDKLFDYDPLYRLIYAKGRESTNQNPNILWGDVLPAGTPNANNCQIYQQFYQYDKLGNIDQWNQSGNNSYTRKYVYDNYSTNNRLSRITNGAGTPTTICNFHYDVNGNMDTSDTDRTYVWDAADQLRAFYIQAGTSEPSVYAQYLYSAGNRSKKIVRTSGGDYEVTVYDGPFEYCKKVSGLTTYEKNYSHVEGVEIRTGTSFPGDITDSIVYQLPDHLGSSNVRLSTAGTIIDKEEYYPFGDTSLRTFTYKRYRYVGKEKDSESGLYYYGARYYASWTCRFISVDLLAAKYAHLTPYNYADNNPINDFDIDGMQNNTTPGGPQQTGNNNNSTANGSTGTAPATNSGTPAQNNTVPTASSNQVPPLLNPYLKHNFSYYNSKPAIKQPNTTTPVDSPVAGYNYVTQGGMQNNTPPPQPTPQATMPESQKIKPATEAPLVNDNTTVIRPNGTNASGNTEGPAIEKKTTETPSENATESSSAPWMDVALEDAKKAGGVKENNEPTYTMAKGYFKSVNADYNPTSAGWCAAFAYNAIDRSGFNAPQTASSQAWLNSKKLVSLDKPAFGAIAVMSNYTTASGEKRDGTGHVGFVYGRQANGKLIILGGNQSNTITFSPYLESGMNTFGSTHQKISGFFWPSDAPLPSDYNLTTFDVKKLKVTFGIATTSKTYSTK